MCSLGHGRRWGDGNRVALSLGLNGNTESPSRAMRIWRGRGTLLHALVVGC